MAGPGNGGAREEASRQALVERVEALSRAVDEQAQRQEELVRALDKRRSEDADPSPSAKGLAKELPQLKSQVKRLEGTSEVNSHEVERLGEKQAELFGKLDERLTELTKRVKRLAKARQGVGGSEARGKPSPSGQEPSSREPADDGSGAQGQEKEAPQPGGTEEERADRKAYKAAYAQLRDGAYAAAGEAFRAFLADFPDSSYAANALYWLGESQYVQGQYAQALQTFRRVQEAYADSGKAPDALLKEGFAYYELQDYRKARRTLLQVVDRFPEDRVAELARKRLEQIRQEQL